MAAKDDDGNVTLAVISNQIEHIQGDVTEINGKIDKSNEGINALNIKTAVIEKSQEGFGKEVDALQQKSNRNDALVVIGNLIVIAGATIANALGLREP